MIMNDWDRNNLNFILTSMDDAFEKWMLEAKTEDIEYALELIARHKRELANIEEKLYDDVTDFTEALAIINRVKEKL
jgi:hypothetical protein